MKTFSMSDLKVLVINALDGRIPLMLQERYPTAEIICAEYFGFYTGWLRSLGFEVIQLDKEMVIDKKEYNGKKYDLILSNPPYQDGNANDEAHKLWPKFVEFAFRVCKTDGFVGMVTPSTWQNPSNDSAGLSIYTDLFLKKDLRVVNLNQESMSNAFKGVGSTFSWWVVRNSDYSGSTKFITESETLSIDIRNHASLPKTISKASLSIIEKIRKIPSRFDWMPQKEYRPTKPEKDSVYQYPYWHTPAKGGRWWYGSEVHPYASTPKVVVSLSGKYVPRIDCENGYTSMCIVAIFDSKTEAENAASLLESKLYRWTLDQFKHSGFTNIKACFSLPKLDISRVWTDSEIYNHFNLTPDEIAYIESNVK